MVKTKKCQGMFGISAKKNPVGAGCVGVKLKTFASHSNAADNRQRLRRLHTNVVRNSHAVIEIKEPQRQYAEAKDNAQQKHTDLHRSVDVNDGFWSTRGAQSRG